MKINIRVYQIVFIILFFAFGTINGQENKKPKIILVTLDGLRWQEVFTGADEKLIGNSNYVSDSISLKESYWKTTPEERRSYLMPFLWNEVICLGELHGNRISGSKVDMRNKRLLSYPGYNELLTGEADDNRIRDNEKIYNPNQTILEQLQRSERYAGQVAAFASWDVFPFIINDRRSGIPVNAGYKEPSDSLGLSETELFLKKIEPKAYSPFGTSARLDYFTQYYALEYMKRAHPDVVYIALDETDDFAHKGQYDDYLRSANKSDALLRELWEFVQSDAYYKDNTTILVTTDHGRGTDPLDSWRAHGSTIKGSEQTWLILFGAGARKVGEVKTDEQLYAGSLVERIREILNL